MRFGSKIREVSEAVVLGVDNYPTTLDAAYRILTETQQRMNADREASERCGAGTTTASAISVTGTSNYQRRSIPDGQDVVMGTDRRVYNVQCNNCNAWGHYARECPRASSEVNNNSKNTNELRNELKYILDTGSTHTTVKDNNDITNLFRSKILRMKSSTGDIMDYKYTGMLKPFGVQAHYNKDGTANILSFHMLAAIKDAHMVYDSRVADCFRLVYNGGREAQFRNNGDGLYIYADPSEIKIWNKNKKVTHKIQLVQTVEKNKQLMTEKEIERANA